METEKFLSPGQAAKLLNVTVRTLYNWETTGKIKCIRTNGNHRRYIMSSIPDYKNFITKETKEIEHSSKRKVCYCRVSTTSQKEDMERQVEYFKREYPHHEIIKDIGSGLNFKRKGFNSILDSAIEGNINEVVVTHKDRLCRFGFELVEHIIGKYDGKIVVLDNEATSPEQELTGDLLSIVGVFSSRLYGLRSHSISSKIKKAVKDKEPSGSESELIEGDSQIENNEV